MVEDVHLQENAPVHLDGVVMTVAKVCNYIIYCFFKSYVVKFPLQIFSFPPKTLRYVINYTLNTNISPFNLLVPIQIAIPE